MSGITIYFKPILNNKIFINPALPNSYEILDLTALVCCLLLR